MAIDEKLLERELKLLDHSQQVLFAARAATRALPALVREDANFSFWSEEDRERNLCAVQRAVSMAYAVVYSSRGNNIGIVN